MKVIRNGCNLNERKGLVAAILAPWTVLKTEVIDIIMKNYTSEVSSFTRFFNEDMKCDFIILKDMVQILFKDKRESNEIREKFVAIKQEKE